jgi:dipeptidyl aminopeptidase/acylaminoacyl peptidase
MLPDCNCYSYFRVRPDGSHRVELSPSVGDLRDISSDGTRVLYELQVGTLSVTRIAGSATPVRVAGTLGAYIDGRLSPDATQVAYLLYAHQGGGQGLGSVHVVGADGLNDRVVVPTGAWSVAWSPSGRSLAYVRVSKPGAGPSQLVTVELATGAERVLAAPAGLIRDVAWSPADDRLAYVVGGLLHVIRADGTHDITISRGVSPLWSPDGRRLAYTWYRQNGRLRGLAVIARDGSLNHLVDTWEGFAAWSPDSRRLVFTSYKETSEQAFLVVADRDGTHRHRLVTGDRTWALGPLRWNRGAIVYTLWVDFGHD